MAVVDRGREDFLIFVKATIGTERRADVLPSQL